ncbi:MAG TPA: glycosyltransferase family 39 protein [Candidatus Sulfotelmatobacter sp.]|nr:glycosyltransferase family 39 protein [Candidatus Sulfotelmatobacter sp.]
MQRADRAVNPISKSRAELSPFDRTSWIHWITLLFLLFAGVAARLWCLASKPFWFDEAFSVEVARLDWRNFLHLLWWREANMSLYYVLLRGWLHFGQSPFFIRSLSVVISGGALLAVYWLGRLLYDRRVGLIAAALLACNAYDVRYAQEARSYALFVLLATVSSGFLIALLKHPSRRNWRGYVLASILAVYAHFYALLLIAAQWLAWRVAGRPGFDSVDPGTDDPARRKLRRAWIAIGVAVSPLLIFVAKTGAGPIKWIARPGIHDLLRFATDMTDGIPVIYLAACLLALVPLRKNILARGPGWETWRAQFLLIWLLFPIALTVLLSFARPVFLARYMIFCIPAMAILAAAGLAGVRPAWVGAVFVCGMLLLSAQFVPFVYSHDFDEERDASGAATDFILDHAAPGDAILFHIAETRVPYEFFRSLRAGTNTASPQYAGDLGPAIVFPNHGRGLDYKDFTGKPTEDLVRTAAAEHKRLWVMLMNNGPAGKPDPTTVMLTEVLPQSLPRVQSWQFAKVEVRLCSRP